MLSEVGVAADHGLDDLSLALPGLAQSHAGADEALPQLGSDMSHFLAADLGEELVDIVYNTITHLCVSSFPKTFSGRSCS